MAEYQSIPRISWILLPNKNKALASDYQQQK
jgi:hypothetical protein